MTDWLVQRHDRSGPVEADGSWIDEGIARDLTADDAQLAVEQIAAGTGHPNARRRASKWQHVEEFDTEPGSVTVTPRIKEGP